MRLVSRNVAVFVALLLSACGRPHVPTGPSASVPLGRIEGNYTLGITAASRCGFPVNDYRWAVVARAGDYNSVFATTRSTFTLANGNRLGDGNTYLDAGTDITGWLELSDNSNSTGGLLIENAPGYYLRVAIGVVGVHFVINSSGRTEVLSSALDGGGISLVHPDARGNYGPGNGFFDCRGAAVGQWSLRAN